MKKLLLVLFTLTVFVVSCGTKEEQTERDTIKISVPESLTGEAAQYGTEIKNGIELKFKEINENGGLLGKKVELIIEDTKGDIQEAISVAKNAVSKDKVDFILGEAASAPTEAIAEVANKSKTVMITPAGTVESITVGRPYVFRATFIDPYQGVAIAKFLKEKGMNKIVLLTNTSSDYSMGVIEAIKKESEKDNLFEIVEYKYTNDDKDFKSILTNVKNQNPDAIVVPDYYNTVGLILSQAKEVGVTSKFIGGDGWDGITVNFAKVAEGNIFASQFSVNDTDEKVKSFVEKYKSEYKREPNIFSALAYDAATLLANAILKAETVDGEKVREALKNTDSDEFVTGAIKFDENNNPIKEVKFLEITNGTTKVVK